MNRPCNLGKVPHFNLREAKDACRKMTSKSHYEPYQCQYLFEGVEHWHITSMPRGQYNKMRKKSKKK